MTESGIKYVGVDGCTGGWVAVGLGDGDESCVKVFGSGEFPNLLEHFDGASVVLVDMPIGLPDSIERGGRACDTAARKALNTKEVKRGSSVFPTPTRPIVNEVIENTGWRQGLGITQQTFGIIPKIAEMDKTVATNEMASSKVREAHPEVCFWALNGGHEAMSYHKSDGLGFLQRFRLLLRWVGDTEDICVAAHEEARSLKWRARDMATDDVLDALALAITAQIGCRQGGFQTLPENPPTDSKGLPMEMVYAIPNEK